MTATDAPATSPGIERAGAAGPSRPPGWSRLLAPVALVATVVGAAALTRADERDIGAWGLVQAYPPVALAAVATLLVLLGLALCRPVEDRLLLYATTLGLATLLHGAAALVESAARFPTAWVHAGIVDAITATGQLQVDVDARYSWPGFFTAASALTGAAGLPSAQAWLTWAGLAGWFVEIPLLVALGRATVGHWRTAWAGTALVLVVTWVGQDYFAPQSLALLMYLAVLVLVLGHLRVPQSPGRVATMLAGLNRGLHPGLDPAETPLAAPQRVGLLVLLTLAALAMASSHQLTPLLMTAALALLALTGRLRPWPVVVVFGAAVAGWLSIGAEPYWRGHLEDIFGSLGRIGSIVDSSMTERIVGSATHMTILQVRVRFAVVLWALAAVAIVVGLVRRRLSVPLVLLTGAPAFLVVAGSYGGEGFLRMLLFSTVGAGFLVATLVVPPHAPGTGWRRAAGPVVLVLVLAAAVPVLGVARYGNESFERISAAEVATAEALVALAPEGSRVFTLGYGGPSMTSPATGLESGGWLIEALADPGSTDMTELREVMGVGTGTTFLVAMRSQVEYGVQNEDLPASWGRDIVATLLASGEYQVAHANTGGVILQQVALP